MFSLVSNKSSCKITTKLLMTKPFCNVGPLYFFSWLSYHANFVSRIKYPLAASILHQLDIESDRQEEKFYWELHILILVGKKRINID